MQEQLQQQESNQAYVASTAPVGQLKANKSLLKYILLSLLTCGIYSIVFFYSISENINAVAGRYDGKKTMNYALLFFLIAPLTLGIGYIVWLHKLSARTGNELRRRDINYSFGAGTFWLWSVLGTLIFVGPFVYLHKLCRSSNMLAEHYNANG